VTRPYTWRDRRLVLFHEDIPEADILGVGERFLLEVGRIPLLRSYKMLVRRMEFVIQAHEAAKL
jgi:hypothetical protein